eukprot:TRINITY_DN14838_c0_g1_i1.p1 TRINITY_DN14838_c0_g1~~TRINITY_DN14838_c0_g1_i1.p1  ORF type:complete len:137 (+),score=7.94 TRINITY_DN14838_c0_g1_i1:70-480(+)
MASIDTNPKKFRVSLDLHSAERGPEWSVTHEHAIQLANSLERFSESAHVPEFKYGAETQAGVRGLFILDISENDGTAAASGETKWQLGCGGILQTSRNVHQNKALARDVVECVLSCAPDSVLSRWGRSELVKAISD